MLALLLAVVAVVGSSAWVFSDANAARKRQTGAAPAEGAGATPTRETSPAAWFVGCLLLWIIFFPAYLVRRRRHAGPQSTAAAWVVTIAAIVLFGGAFVVHLAETPIYGGPPLTALNSDALSQYQHKYGQSSASSANCAGDYAPSLWTKGYQFTCRVYNANGTRVGSVQITATSNAQHYDTFLVVPQAD